MLLASNSKRGLGITENRIRSGTQITVLLGRNTPQDLYAGGQIPAQHCSLAAIGYTC